MKQFLQNITAFTKRERRGAYIFLLILLTIIIINRSLPGLIQHEPWFINEDTVQINQWLKSLKQRELKLKAFDPNKVDIQDLIQMGLPATICSNWAKYLDAGGKFYSKSDVKRLYGMADSIFYKLESYLIIKESSNKSNIQEHIIDNVDILDFDPNADTYEQLLNAGLSGAVATNIINYRQKSSGYKRKEDLRKLFAISDNLYLEMEPHIIIQVEPESIVLLDSVELNSTTFDELLNLGVNKRLAKSLIGYRNVLGGFYSHDQLDEVYNMDTSSIRLIRQNSWIDTLLIKRMNLNIIDQQKLMKHPYITKLQARKLIQYKNFSSKVENYQEIKSLNIFSPDLASKLRIYFAF
jgi:competence protein ComEA